MNCTRRHTLVTGASTGIGRATALRLAAAGQHVYAGVRQEAHGDQLIRAAAGGQVTPLLLDVTPAGQAVAWLRALAAGTRGEANADALLATGELPGIASFEALLRADAATAAAEGHSAAERARAQAEAALRGLGAGAHTARLLPATADTPAADPLAVLSDRERDVVTLLLEGLSYAQIARELYVTRSTVAFHLSNAYAKTGTTSRHELVQLVRAA
jgi:DNA-binding CsgD family transcriptional regulator